MTMETHSQAIQAVSVAVRDGNRLLLVMRGRAPSAGLYAFPGGRIEPGETVTDAAARELMEETRLRARNMRVFAEVTLDREDDSVETYHLTVHVADYDGGTALAGDDAAALGWFTIEEMRDLPITASTLAAAEEMLGGRR